jgi:XTP/dITP diphosphohydrolase
MTTLFLATRNLHKIREIVAILDGPYQFQSLSDYPSAPTVVEDASTFEENAKKKSVELARWLTTGARPVSATPARLLVVADDSGLEVDALAGAPGVHSARFAASDPGSHANSPDAENTRKLLDLLKDIPPDRRSARFRCVIALTPVFQTSNATDLSAGAPGDFESRTRVFQGACEGRIGFCPRGKNGFGYDPVFVPSGLELTFAELGDGEKNQLSHRARALRALQEYLSNSH